MTLYPASISEARDPAGFNVSAFVADVPADAQAIPGKGIIPSKKYIDAYWVGSGMEKYM